MPEGQQPGHTPPIHETSLAPDEVARRSFSTTFRGYDQHEVRGFLTRIAAEVRMLLDRERDLRRRLDSAEHRPPPPAPVVEPDEQQLIAALGSEAAKVIQAAREAAAEIRSKAEEHVGRLVREAQDEAARVRTEAEQLLEIRTAEAEQAAEAIRSEAVQEADAELERARARGREMVAEAQAVRERLLRDLARRRRTAHAQIEQLRAGRDRLLEAYRVVRQTLEEATAELTRAEPEARAAAESAALRAAGEAEATVEEMEAELATARDLGTARDSDLAPVFDPEPAIASGAPAAVAPAVPAAGEVGEAGEAGGTGGAAGASAGETDVPAAPVPAETGLVTSAAETAPAPPEAEPTGPREVPPAAPPTPAPTGAYEEVPAEERRSSLRLLRRRRAEQAVSEGEVSVVDPGDAVEGVRVLRPPAASPAEPATDQPADAETAGGEGAAAAGSSEAAGDEEAADAEAADAVGAADGGDTGVAGDEPDLTVAVAGEADRRPASVEELFARIRAERAESVARAEEVISRTTANGSAAAEPSEAAAEPDDRADEPVAGDAGEAADDSPDAGGGGADEALLEQRDAQVEPIERRATRALKRALADEQNDVLDRLRRHKGAPSVDVLLGDAAEQVERYAGAVRDALRQAATAGAGFDGGFGGGDDAAGDVEVEDLATAGAADLAGGLRQRVERLVEEGGDGGEQAITTRLSSVYRELKTQRAESLVRDAVVAAFNRGAYAAVPDGVRVRWVVDFDGKPCPDGDDNALAGALMKGDAFPTGQCLPPAHAGCRCILVPDTL